MKPSRAVGWSVLCMSVVLTLSLGRTCAAAARAVRIPRTRLAPAPVPRLARAAALFALKPSALLQAWPGAAPAAPADAAASLHHRSAGNRPPRPFPKALPPPAPKTQALAAPGRTSGGPFARVRPKLSPIHRHGPHPQQP